MSLWKTNRTVLARLMAWGAAAAGVLSGTAAWAQTTPQSEFVPLSSAAATQQETLSASPLVYGAYAFVWVALIVYVFLLWRRIGKVERELADVTLRLSARR